MPVITPDPQGDRSVLKDAYTQVFRIVRVGEPVNGVALVTIQITSTEEYPAAELAVFEDEQLAALSAEAIWISPTEPVGAVIRGEGKAAIGLHGDADGNFTVGLQKLTPGSVWIAASVATYGGGPYACSPRKLEVEF